MEKTPMQVHVTYPQLPPHSFWRRNRRELTRALFAFLAYACALVNLCVGGIPWSLAAIGGLAVIWIVFFYRPLVENTRIKKMTDVGAAICLYLFMLDWIFGVNWSGFVALIVFFADLIIAGTYFLAYFKKEKRNFLPLFELMLGGLVAIFCGLVGWSRLDWPMIVVGSVSLALAILTVALHFTAIRREIQKKIHW
ncbi:MAG: DUF6320 domain-containing protein [Eubacteriales bacterium]|nr:DUF6320 domain-containing protein [Eubacteriales bacterium]